ncbi:MAG: hypothetical protein K0Q93_50 [Nocardioidaceae bacterium]|nr:hypothetical protein [Nocardioidaceae bacterium]
MHAAYLHIGLHKTGTTYFQHLMAANRSQLREHGILYPGGEGRPNQHLAVLDLLGRRVVRAEDRRIAGAWSMLVEESRSVAADLLVSEEHLSVARPAQVRQAVSAFADDREVHVVVTARDLARVLVSAWHEEIKVGSSRPWKEFTTAVRDPARVGTSPARGFYARQDLPAILERWARVVPAERIHVVTVPPRGAPTDLLVSRLGSVIGFEPAWLTQPAGWGNPAVGLLGTELLRRLNPALSELNQRQRDRVLKQVLARVLAKGVETVPLGVTGDELEWARERAAAMIAAVRAGGYDVVGELTDLDPQPVPGRSAQDVGDDELLDAAVVALGGLAQRYATSWWSNKPTEDELQGRSRDKLASRLRAVTWGVRSRAARLADRNAVAGRALGVLMRRRSA